VSPSGDVLLPVPHRWYCLVFSAGALVVGFIAISRALQVRRVPVLWGQRAARAYRFGLLGGEVLLFAMFFLGFYLLEVYASYKAPYYLYPRIWLPRLPALLPHVLVGPFPDFAPSDGCAKLVTDYLRTGDNRWHAVPLEVPLMEATLAYVMFRTTRLLGSPPWASPLLAAGALLALDIFLDPAVADVRDCNNGWVADGAGLWRWFLDKESMRSWHMIPLFNYAAWYGGALLAVAFGQFATSFVTKRAWRRGRFVEVRHHRFGLILAIMGIVAVVVLKSTAKDLGGVVLAACIVVALLVAGVVTSKMAATNHKPRLAFIAPVLFFLAIALLAYVWFGLWSTEAKHIVAAFGAVLICLALTFLPYWRRVL
jgi:hypothetical protein